MSTIDILAQIVILAGEIRADVKAKGAESQRLFEEALTRNKKSYDDILNDMGGEPQQPPDVPPIEPPDTPPAEPPEVPPPAPLALYDSPIAGDLPSDFSLKTQGYKSGDQKFTRNDQPFVAWLILRPGVPIGWPNFKPAGTIV